MTDEPPIGWRTPAQRDNDIAQAKSLRQQAAGGDLSFEVYLPSGLAEWVLDFVERGVFTDPSEAVFVIMGEHRDLEPHSDLRLEIRNRSLDAAMNDPGLRISGEDFLAELEELANKPRRPVAKWVKQKYE